MRAAVLLLSATLLLPSSAAAGQLAPIAGAATETSYQPRMLTAEEAREDIALLRRALETIHPGLYRYTSRASINAAFSQLERAGSRPINDLALHGEIALLLASIHCDHTKPEMPDAATAFRKANPTHLPFRFQIIEGRMIVTASDGQAGAPPLDSEILEINGMATPSLLTRLAAAVAYDGETDQAIAVKLGDDSDLMGDDFNEYYPSFFGFPKTWRLRWKAVGDSEAISATLAPIRFDQWTRLEAPGGRFRNEFYKAVTWRIADKTALLKIDTFVNYRNPVQPTAFLGGFFKAMKEAGTERLILDLRSNGGGSEDVSIALGRYLIEAPFTWSKPIRYKTIGYGDLPQYIESWGDRDALFNPPVDQFSHTSDGWLDRIPDKAALEANDDESTIAHLPSPDQFKGGLVILTSPANGSGATRTIAQLKERAGATLIGENSSGSAEGPTAGQIFLMTLPRSGIKVRIPNAWNRTNISHWVANMGVPADFEVIPTLADYQARRDRALEVARAALPPSPSQNPTSVLPDLLRGTWIGALDYRDYGDDSRVTLPTRLEAEGLTFAWTFDDGPGKTVRSRETWTFDPSGHTLTISEGKSQSTRKVEEFRTSADGALTLVFDGNGVENGKPVRLRGILTLDKGVLRLTETSGAKGAPLLMRHSYEMKRQGA